MWRKKPNNISVLFFFLFYFIYSLSSAIAVIGQSKTAALRSQAGRFIYFCMHGTLERLMPNTTKRNHCGAVCVLFLNIISCAIDATLNNKFLYTGTLVSIQIGRQLIVGAELRCRWTNDWTGLTNLHQINGSSEIHIYSELSFKWHLLNKFKSFV